MNSSGKVLIIFLAISAILLVSLTAVSLYFVHLETERRKLAEVTLEEYQGEQVKVDEELKGIKKQNFLLQEKNKEADARVIDLSDELELEKGLREEMKIETVALQETIAEFKKTKEDHAKEISDKEGELKKLSKNFSLSQRKIKELEGRLKAEMERSQKLGKLYEQKQKEGEQKVAQLKVVQEEGVVQRKVSADKLAAAKPSGIELEEIVIIPNQPKKSELRSLSDFDEPIALLEKEADGRILSVDRETEFVIVSLGEKDGLSLGNILSVYRNNDYVGDIKITRLQSEMSAANIILPLSIKGVQKNDQVKAK